MPNDFDAFAWDLGTIIAKMRDITGQPDVNAFTDQTMTDFVNQFTLYVLPKVTKIFWGYTYYSFFTFPNVATYTPPANFQTLNPVVTVNGFPMDWYLWPDQFNQDYPIEVNQVPVATTDGVTNSYTFTVSAYPILPGSLFVTDGGAQLAQDNGNGGFINPLTGLALTGTISYVTGTVNNLAFAAISPANQSVVASSGTYFASRPQGILYYNNQFVLRNVPDQVYQIQMEGIRIPLSFLNYTDTSSRPDLGPLIAYGAALEIFNKFEQKAQYDKYFPDYQRYLDVCMQDTYEEYLYERSVPKF